MSKGTSIYIGFDDHGNWIECDYSKKYLNSSGDEKEPEKWKITRTIVYYDDAVVSSDMNSVPIHTQFDDRPDQYQPSTPYFILYQADISGIGGPQETIEQVIALLSDRLSAYGTSDQLIEQFTENRIRVNLSGIDKSEFERLLMLLAGTNVISFMEVATDEFGEPVLDDTGHPCWIPAMGVVGGKQLEMTSEYIVDAATDFQFDRSAGSFEHKLYLDFDDIGSELMWQITSKLSDIPTGSLEKQLGIFVDDVLISSPNVNDPIRENVTVTGIAVREANLLEELIEGDAIPVPLEIIDSGTFDPFEK